MKSNMASPDSSLQTSCGKHPASYPMGTADSSPGQQSNDDVKLTFHFTYSWRYTWSYDFKPFTSSYCGT